MGSQCIRPLHEDKIARTENLNPIRRGLILDEKRTSPTIRSTTHHLLIENYHYRPHSNHLYCLICKDKYGIEERQPVLICMENHTICSVCKDMLLATKVERCKVCSFCKRLLRREDDKVNENLLAMIE